MNKFLIVFFLDAKIPSVFSKVVWPFHVTVIRPFETAMSEKELIDILGNFTFDLSGLNVTSKSRELFGEDGTIPVTVLEDSEILSNLRDELMKILNPSVTFIGSQFDTYRPHVSDQGGKGIALGKEYALTDISLVEIHDDMRKVVFVTDLK